MLLLDTGVHEECKGLGKRAVRRQHGVLRGGDGLYRVEGCRRLWLVVHFRHGGQNAPVAIDDNRCARGSVDGDALQVVLRQRGDGIEQRLQRPLPRQGRRLPTEMRVIGGLVLLHDVRVLVDDRDSGSTCPEVDPQEPIRPRPHSNAGCRARRRGIHSRNRALERPHSSCRPLFNWIR